MKTKNIITRAILATAIAAIFTTKSTFATESFNVQPSTVYHFIKSEPLSNALDQLAKQSDIVFKINVNLGKNIVSQTFGADGWSSAIKALLVEYNYTIIQDGKIKTVIISGYNGNAPDEPKAMDSIMSMDDSELMRLIP